MILVIVERERDDRGNYDDVVSHGIDLNTGSVIMLPQVSTYEVGAVYDYNMGEYVIMEDEEE